MSPVLQDWNLQSLAVMQAMLGMLSPNFRMVTLDHDGAKWLISFVLQHEDAEDREEIEDFLGEWEALQSRFEMCVVNTVITPAALSWPKPPARVLYRRREVQVAEV